MSNEPVVVIGIGEALRESPYGARLASLLDTLQVEWEFWRWVRSGTDRAEMHTRTLLRTHRSGGLRQKVFCVLLWIFVTARAVLALPRGRAVFCIGSLSTIGPILVAACKNINVVFINNDNVAISYDMPHYARAVVAVVESGLARMACVHVIPSGMRWKGWKGNLVVAHNSPTRELMGAGREIAGARKYARDATFTVYVNGWLTERRGMDMLLRTVKRFGPSELRVIVAGKPKCKAAEELIKLDMVENVGSVSRQEAIALYFRADLTATFYDPAIPINRLAESNKWYECLLTGTPFVVNSEVITAAEFCDAGVCFSVPYNDVDALESLFRKVIEDGALLEDMRRKADSVVCKTFEDEFAPVFAKLARVGVVLG